MSFEVYHIEDYKHGKPVLKPDNPLGKPWELTGSDTYVCTWCAKPCTVGAQPPFQYTPITQLCPPCTQRETHRRLARVNRIIKSGYRAGEGEETFDRYVAVG